jgi:hypothetical protein
MWLTPKMEAVAMHSGFALKRRRHTESWEISWVETGNGLRAVANERAAASE